MEQESGDMTPLEKSQESLQRAAKALNQICAGMGDFVRAWADFMVATYVSSGLLETAQRAAQVEVALKEAPPRVRHLAQHSKKYRTRKKNINRALRSYNPTK